MYKSVLNKAWNCGSGIHIYWENQASVWYTIDGLLLVVVACAKDALLCSLCASLVADELDRDPSPLHCYLART